MITSSFSGRIIEPLDRQQQSVDAGRLTIKRGDHGVDRQGLRLRVTVVFAQAPADERRQQP
jgi:hypothetical protein